MGGNSPKVNIEHIELVQDSELRMRKHQLICPLSGTY